MYNFNSTAGVWNDREITVLRVYRTFFNSTLVRHSTCTGTFFYKEQKN